MECEVKLRVVGKVRRAEKVCGLHRISGNGIQLSFFKAMSINQWSQLHYSSLLRSWNLFDSNAMNLDSSDFYFVS